jgi:hypothetical protein
MAREYICLYFSYLDYIQPLTDEERGRLLTALLTYGATGDEPDMAGNERMVFPAIRSQIDRDTEKYKNRCERNTENAMNRWKGPRSGDANAYERMQSHANGCETCQGKGKGEGDIIPPIVPPRGRKTFSPPTVDEVAAYCEERGNGIDAQSFVDFYASKGWVVGKSPMKDWKAAVRTWERSDSRSSKPKAVSSYDPYAGLPWD